MELGYLHERGQPTAVGRKNSLYEIETEYTKILQEENKSIVSPMCGGLGGNAHTIILEENEFVSEVRYRYGHYFNQYTVILMLTFITNQGKTYGPFGIVQRGFEKKFEYKGGPLIGFEGHGREFLYDLILHFAKLD